MNDIDVSPTRMELQNVDEKLVLAVRGHDLLKKKRDTLIAEHIKAKEEAGIFRGDVEALSRECFLKAELVEMKMGSLSYRSTAYNKSKRIEVVAGYERKVGVKLPVVDVNMSRDEGFSYSLIGTPAELDVVVEMFRKLSIMAARLAGMEKKVHVLDYEIRNTRRKVNALEKVKIANLVGADKYIRNYLDEMEREDYSRLKHIKKIIKRG